MMRVEKTIDLRERGPEKVGFKGEEIGGGKGGILNRVWNRVANRTSDRGRNTVEV